MGFETIPFHTPDELAESRTNDVVAGYVATVKSRLIESCQEFGVSKEAVFQKIMDKFDLREEQTSDKRKLYWKE